MGWEGILEVMVQIPINEEKLEAIYGGVNRFSTILSPDFTQN